ncbi:MAG TPA: N-6 DNA methylase, partial [Symbiobacteriaceae bacterium]|nr:N-6 DNA methylase [Symbiobacteriaceae bacterium]
MGNFSLAIRRMTVATISWFLEGRRVPAFKDNASTRERAVTINAPIMYHWFGEEARTKAKRKFDVRCRYLDGSGPELSHEIILEAKRPILFQSKNWRLSGDAIPGQFYGTLREGDLLLMSFHRETQTLSWLCVRGPGALDRHVPEQELITHGQLLSLLGEAENNMWLPHPDVANEVIRVSAQLYPTAARLLGESYSYKEVCRQLWRQFTDEGFPSQQALEQISLLLMLRRLCALDEQDREVRVWLKDFTTWADIRLGGFTAVQNALSRLPRPFAAVMEGGSLSLRTMRILDETLVLVEMLPLGATDHAQSGEIYSELISYLDTGRSGQYPTPPLVTDLMVSLANPTASDYVLDPVAGTGRLLQEAHRRMCGLSSWRPSSVME